MSWDVDKEPRRAPGPSKAELERQLQEAVRNTGGVDTKPQSDSQRVKEIQSESPRIAPATTNKALKSDLPGPIVRRAIEERPEPQAKSPHHGKTVGAFVCERCGGPRSQYSSAVCRACYLNKRAEGPELLAELREARKDNFELVRNIRLVRSLEFALTQVDRP